MKRIFDLALALFLLVVLAPLLLLLSLAVLIALGRPVFFVQQRPGYQGKPFNLIKFRTMKDSATADGKPRPDAERLTRFGAGLRNLSLDELPELLNIVKGDMSFVGPRPLLMEYLPLYNEEQRRRHEVRPGITGWAQVKYHYGASKNETMEKLQYDLFYIKNMSFLFDLSIIFDTVRVVLSGAGAR